MYLSYRTFFVSFRIFNIIEQQTIRFPISQLQSPVDIQDPDPEPVGLYLAA